MNNCIGALNQKYFVLFLVYSILQTLTTIIIVSIRLASCNGIVAECFYGEGGRLLISCLVFTLFGLTFVTSMLSNQFYGVRTGIGTIDRMKRRTMSPERSTKYKPIRWIDVFGNGSYFLWPIPVAPQFNNIDLIVSFSVREEGESLMRDSTRTNVV
jgi:palmitoyltransferase ZDHHC3/7/25